MIEDEYVGGSFYKHLITDARVTKNLQHCLYCKVITASAGDVHSGTEKSKPLDYKIPLDCINGNIFKQCPACKRIYILGDPV